MAVKLVPVTKPKATDPYADVARQQMLADLLQKRATEGQRRPQALTSTAAALNGVSDIISQLGAVYAGQKADKMKAGADRDTSDQNRALIQAMMQRPGVQVEGLDDENPGFTTPGKLDPAANDLTQAVSGLDPMAVKEMLAKTVYERALPKPKDDYSLTSGMQRRSGETNEVIGDNPVEATIRPDKWSVVSKPLPNGMVQDYKFNEVNGERIPIGDPYKPIDTTPNINIGGFSVKPVEIVDPKDKNKIMVIDAQSGKILGYKAKETPWGERTNVAAFNSSGAGETIDEAMAILKYGNPTASGFGSLVDVVLNFVKINTDSATQAAKLAQIGATLTSKVPKFKGQDSDKDRKLYEQAAGMVGDNTKPAPQRIAALEEARRILTKYEDAEVGFAADGNEQDAEKPKETAAQRAKRLGL